MNKNDTDCIKYILDEMDPAERIEYERKISQDADLLIEVESLKSIRHKIDSLALIKPPEDLTNSILHKAKKQSPKRQIADTSVSAIAAALFVITLAGGAVLITDDEPQYQPRSEAAANISTGQFGLVDDAPENKIAPWVDKNQTLYFTGRSSSDRATFETELQKSYNKLNMVNSSGAQKFTQNGLQLTGSRN